VGAEGEAALVAAGLPNTGSTRTLCRFVQLKVVKLRERHAKVSGQVKKADSNKKAVVPQEVVAEFAQAHKAAEINVKAIETAAESRKQRRAPAAAGGGGGGGAGGGAGGGGGLASLFDSDDEAAGPPAKQHRPEVPADHHLSQRGDKASSNTQRPKGRGKR